MNKKRLLRVLAGEAISPPPVWLMRQAGRYLPEFRALRAQADFITRCMTPEIATEITLQPIRRYGMDGAILFSDILILPWAMGQPLRFEEGRGPVLEPLRSRDSLSGLRPDQVRERTRPVMETLGRLRAVLDAPPPASGTTLLGFAGAPFTVACYMIEGGGSHDFAITRGLAFGESGLVEQLVALLATATADMLCDQIEAGAEAVMLFDSWSGLLPSGLFRQLVIEPTRQVTDRVRARCPGVPIIGFPRLAGLSIAPYAAETGIDAITLDTAADLEVALRLLPPGMPVQGNLDPLCLLQGGRALEQEVGRILTLMRGRPHVFNLGHGVLPQTPPEHVAALVGLVRRSAG